HRDGLRPRGLARSLRPVAGRLLALVHAGPRVLPRRGRPRLGPRPAADPARPLEGAEPGPDRGPHDRPQPPGPGSPDGSRPRPPARGGGTAAKVSDGAPHVAVVAEVPARGGGGRADRVAAALDCGPAVNPLGIERQVESGVVWALATVFFGEITIARGRVQ